MQFTSFQARAIILHAAGLSSKGQFGTGLEAVQKVILHLGFLQLDTNSVVERAHHHMLAARIPEYEPHFLSDLSADGDIFEYFLAESGYMPIADFRFTLPVKESFKSRPLDKLETSTMKEILERIELDGPLSVSDFENDRVEASTGWWDWRPAKVALERLYLNGDLMISRTPTFKKRYDLPINLLPVDVDTTMPNPAEYARYTIRRTLGALGIAGVKEIAWRGRRVKGNPIKEEMNKMVASGELIPVTITDVKTPPQFMLAAQETNIKLSGDVYILSPFDILNIYRHRLKDYFNFDYQLECFVPAPKRRYGYFSLPVLIGNTFIARMDAKAERKTKTLLIHNLHFEEVTLTDEMLLKSTEEFKAFARFNQCHNIHFDKTNRKDYLKVLRKELE